MGKPQSILPESRLQDVQSSVPSEQPTFACFVIRTATKIRGRLDRGVQSDQRVPCTGSRPRRSHAALQCLYVGSICVDVSSHNEPAAFTDSETVPQAKAAARKALELEDTLPEAHNSLGLVLALHDFDFAQSKKEFERAIELNPNYATAHHQFGNMNLTMVGEFDRAIAEGKRAVELDPLSLIINADLGVNFLLARRYDQAVDQLRKTLAMDPRFYSARLALGEALQLKGQLGEAMTEYQKAAEVTDDPVVLAYLAQGYAKTGQGDKAWNLLSQLEQLATERHVGPFILAMVHLALGEKEKAVDELERAYRERADPFIVGIKVEPLLDPLRGDPRFEHLVAKVAGTAESK
jgi:tetratricopeptide (TPR) repeat protein